MKVENKLKMVNFAESKEKSDTRNSGKHTKVKESKSEVIQNHIKGMKSVVKNLETSLTDTHLEQRHLLIQMHVDDIKNQSVTSQLEKAKKENKQLINILQKKGHDNKGSRSQVEVASAYSTLSAVNVQYDYEDLAEKYDGLLKLMSTRDDDINNCYEDNDAILEELNSTSRKLFDTEYVLKRVCEKYKALKQRKDNKIYKLRNEKETLILAHNQVVMLLHQMCMKNEELLTQHLHRALKPERALLLKEIQHSNQLQHENILLRQELTCLKSKCVYPNLRNPKTNLTEEKSKTDLSNEKSKNDISNEKSKNELCIEKSKNDSNNEKSKSALSNEKSRKDLCDEKSTNDLYGEKTNNDFCEKNFKTNVLEEK